MPPKTPRRPVPPDATANAPLETERRFLVDRVPPSLPRGIAIAQGYLAAENDVEVRLRRKGSSAEITVKAGRGISRTEIPIPVRKAVFANLWPLTAGRRVEKVRHVVPCDGREIEVNVYRGPLAGFAKAEIEFPSEADARTFRPPPWLGREVTDDPAYNDRALAEHGVPRATPKAAGPRPDVRTVLKAVASAARPGRRTVVLIAGGSASGKTTIAKAVVRALGRRALLLSADHYYRGVPFMRAMARKGAPLTWDDPDALDLPLLARHVALLAAGRTVKRPAYSFKTGRRGRARSVRPRPVIVVEGLFVLRDPVAPAGDVKVFVETDMHGRMLRRLLRDVERTGQDPMRVLRQFAEEVEPMHGTHVQGQKDRADVVIPSPYDPRAEAARAALRQRHIKFRADVDDAALCRAGAERLAAVRQVDRYRSPAGRDLRGRGESLRIRRENGTAVLAYKGPAARGGRPRPVLQFGIDRRTERAVAALYGSRTATVAKDRVLYLLRGAIVSVDDVRVERGGRTAELGRFLEIRIDPGEPRPLKRAREIATAAGAGGAKPILLPYPEIPLPPRRKGRATRERPT